MGLAGQGRWSGETAQSLGLMRRDRWLRIDCLLLRAVVSRLAQLGGEVLEAIVVRHWLWAMQFAPHRAIAWDIDGLLSRLLGMLSMKMSPLLS